MLFGTEKQISSIFCLFESPDYDIHRSQVALGSHRVNLGSHRRETSLEAFHVEFALWGAVFDNGLQAVEAQFVECLH